MMWVKTGIELPVEISDDATRNGYSHSEDVDEYEQFVLHQVPDGDEQEVFEHMGRGFFQV